MVSRHHSHLFENHGYGRGGVRRNDAIVENGSVDDGRPSALWVPFGGSQPMGNLDTRLRRAIYS